MAKRKSTPKRKPIRRRTKPGSKKSKLIWLLLLLPIGAVVYFGFFDQEEPKVETSSNFHKIVPEGYKSVGIDVSHHQGEINWEILFKKAKFDTVIDFVYCKATEGSDYTDAQWARNREQLNSLGVLNGAYHYFNTTAAPRPQAEHFLSVYKPRSIDLPPVLDVEEEGISDEDLIAKIKIWSEVIKKRIGVQPIIYTSLSFYETKFRGKLDGFQFWLAAYSREPAFMNDPNVLHWQFSEKGKLPGISELVDLNVSNKEF